jgi:hypothetical protein
MENRLPVKSAAWKRFSRGKGKKRSAKNENFSTAFGNGH